MLREEILHLAAEMAGPYRLVPPGETSGGMAGMFAGRRDGQSVDFHDYREYQPGDDLRRVDWRTYARSGQMYLRLFREEVSPVVEIHLDTSASMAAYPGKESIALFAAAFLREVVLAAEGRPILCGRGERYASGDFLPALLGTNFSGTDTFARPTSGVVRPLRFFLSDCLWADGLEQRMRQGAAGCLSFLPLAILSKSEVSPPWRGRFRLTDVEKPDACAETTIDAAAIAEYHGRLARHRETLERLAQQNSGRLLWWETPDATVGREDCLAFVGHLVKERVVAPR